MKFDGSPSSIVKLRTVSSPRSKRFRPPPDVPNQSSSPRAILLKMKLLERTPQSSGLANRRRKLPLRRFSR